jgi:palmitoyl-protein thioesterase
MPYINNEITHSRSELFKTNFLRIKKYVIYGSEHDGVVSPWQTQFYGFYDENMKIVPMEQQEVFQKDTFGLRTLNLTRRLIINNIPKVEHLGNY